MSIQKVIDNNIELINRKTLEKLNNGNMSNNINPKYPSVIINYNLRNDDMDFIKKYMNQLWKRTYNSIEIVEMSSIKKSDDLTAIINKLRGNNKFESYVTIYIHLLYNATTASVEELMEKINSLFYDKTTYTVIAHAFFDMALYNNKHYVNKLDLLLQQEKIEYTLIYQNKLQNGALWNNKNEYKIFRLMSNVIALMINADKLDLFAENNGVHTFSYTLLEKPVKKIVQIVLRELLADECLNNKYELEDKFERNVENLILKSVKDETNKLAEHYYFEKNDFQYLPNNKELTMKVANFDSANYQLLYSCYEEMIEERKKFYVQIHKFKII